MKRSHLLFLSLFLFGCEGFYKVPPANPYAIPPAGPSDNIPPLSPDKPPEEFGVLKCHESQEGRFLKELKQFLSPSIHPNQIPLVNCSGRTDLKGGVWIRGEVNFEDDAVFDPNSETQQLYVSRGSYLEIHVVGIDNKPFPGMKLNAVPFIGSVEGQLIVLAFQDQKGRVDLDGTVANGVFSGPFKYKNFTTWEGGSYGYEGQIGHFSIHVCSLLNCGQK